MPTIHDIARACNFSKSTVARALKGEPVNEKTREIVLEKARELGYSYNLSASLLANKKERVIYAFLIESITSGYDKAMKKGIDTFFYNKRDFKMKCEYFYTPKTIDPESYQYNQFIKMIDDNPAAVIISPISSQILDKIVEICNQKKIPVITLDLPFYNQKSKHIGPDYYKVGSVSANLLANMINFKGNALVIYFNDQYNLAKCKLEGFDREIQLYNDINTTKINIVDYDKLEEQLRLVFKDKIDIIYAIYDGEKIYSLCEKLGFTNIPIITNDRDDSVTELVKQNKIRAIVHQKPFYQGYVTAYNIYKYFYENSDYNNENVDTGIDILIKENLYFTENYMFIK